MKISEEAELYADTLFFNQSRLIHEKAKKDLLGHKFVSSEDTAQKDYSLQREAATEMAAARMDSYVKAYEAEGEEIGHEDVVEFIQTAKDIIDRQSRLIPTMSGGTITMVRNQWTPEYMDQMLTLFREEAFIKLEPKMNQLILRSKEAPLRKALTRKMSKRNDLFRWIYEQCGGKQYVTAWLPDIRTTYSGWPDKDLGVVSDYLAGEGLIEQKDDTGSLVWLTHKGVKAGESPVDVEKGASSPMIQPTQNINNFHSQVGSVQTGDNSLANVVINVGAKLEDVAGLLNALRSEIDAQHTDAGNEYIDAIEDELGSIQPRESRLRLFLTGVGGFATEAGKAIVGEVAKKLLTGELSL